MFSEGQLDEWIKEVGKVATAQSIRRPRVLNFSFGQWIISPCRSANGIASYRMAASISEIIERVELKLSQLLTDSDRPAPALVYQSMQHMYAWKGNLSVADLADQVHFSERHLRRAFHRELGLSPKEMLGIVRF